jgi:hypothetical protein
MALEMFRCLLSNETRIASKLFCNFSYVQNCCKRSSFFFFINFTLDRIIYVLWFLHFFHFSSRFFWSSFLNQIDSQFQITFVIRPLINFLTWLFISKPSLNFQFLSILAKLNQCKPFLQFNPQLWPKNL